MCILFPVRRVLSGDEWREVRLRGADTAPEIAGGTEPITQQDDTPDLQVATGVLVASDEESTEEGSSDSTNRRTSPATPE
jgi:hypothetical protein